MCLFDIDTKINGTELLLVWFIKTILKLLEQLCQEIFCVKVTPEQFYELA